MFDAAKPSGFRSRWTKQEDKLLKDLWKEARDRGLSATEADAAIASDARMLECRPHCEAKQVQKRRNRLGLKTKSFRKKSKGKSAFPKRSKWLDHQIVAAIEAIRQYQNNRDRLAAVRAVRPQTTAGSFDKIAHLIRSGKYEHLRDQKLVKADPQRSLFDIMPQDGSGWVKPEEALQILQAGTVAILQNGTTRVAKAARVWIQFE